MKLTDSFGDERAVSPVVGVILMVAITVILAAVIGTFVLDLGNNQTAPPRAGISFENTATGEVTATVTDPGNVESLTLKIGNDAGDGQTLGSFSNTNAGTTAVSTGLDDGDVLQVIGTNNGQSGVVSTYTV